MIIVVSGTFVWFLLPPGEGQGEGKTKMLSYT